MQAKVKMTVTEENKLQILKAFAINFKTLRVFLQISMI